MNSIYKLMTVCIALCITGCSDYQAGFTDGYGGADSQQWVVFGKADYLQGYSTGEADRFQQDWVAANPAGEVGPTCRAPVIASEAVMFSPVGYQRIADDVFRIAE